MTRGGQEKGEGALAFLFVFFSPMEKWFRGGEQGMELWVFFFFLHIYILLWPSLERYIIF